MLDAQISKHQFSLWKIMTCTNPNIEYEPLNMLLLNSLKAFHFLQVVNILTAYYPKLCTFPCNFIKCIPNSIHVLYTNVTHLHEISRMSANIVCRK